MTEILTTPDGDAQFFPMVDGLGNHEAKGLVGGIILSNPSEVFPGGRLNNEVRDRQKGENGWVPTKRVPLNYCVNTLGPIGAVVRRSIEIRRGITTGFQATQLGALQGLAVVGANSEWGLDHPELSVQELFSVTASKGGRRAPATRYIIFQALLSSPTGSATYGELNEAVNEQLGIADSRIDSIFSDDADSEIFKVSTNLRGYNPVFHIDQAEYRGTRPLDTLKDDTQAVYAALASLVVQGRREVALDEIVAEASLSIHGVPKNVLRQRIVNNLTSSVSLPGLTLIDGTRPKVGKDTQSSVSLQPEIRPAIQELIERLSIIRRGEDVGDFHKSARTILDTPKWFAQLMRKAATHSSTYKSHTNPVLSTEKVLDVLRREAGEEAVDLSFIQHQLAAQGSPYKRATVGLAIRRLIDGGHVAADEVPVAEDKAVMKRVFRVLEN